MRPLTPRHREPIVIHGTSIEAPGFDSPEDLGAPTVPFRVRFSYDRRMGDIRKGVPVPRHGSVNPRASVARFLTGSAASKATCLGAAP